MILVIPKPIDMIRNRGGPLGEDKVAKVKRARDEEEAPYRKELETQLEKVHHEARNESFERTVKQQLQFEFEQKRKAQEGEINALKEKWNKERNEILTMMKAYNEAMVEASKKFEVAKKQMMTEMDTALRKAAEEKAKALTEADQQKAEELSKQAEKHQAELDKIRREVQQAIANNQYYVRNSYIKKILIFFMRDEIKIKDSQLASKDKQIIDLGEKLSRLQCERDKLQNDVKRYKQGNSFSKTSPKSPSIEIGDKSFEEVTAATITPKVYSENEKDVILNNDELNFRLKEVEKQNQMLKEAKENLEHTMDQLKESNKSLEENKKLFQRCIDMQGAKQCQEMNNQLISEINDLKTRNASLEKEVAQQRKRLTHFFGESEFSRSTMSSLKAQNEHLQSDNNKLNAKVLAGECRCSELQLNLERLRKLNYKLKKSAELEKARLTASPEPSNTLELSQSRSDLAAVDEESHCSILQEELEQMSQGGTSVTDSISGRTINDVVRDLISEVDGSTLGLLVSDQVQASQAQDVAAHHNEEKEHLHQLKETISNMQLELNQLNLENNQVKQQVSQLTQERDQLREGYNQLEQQTDQTSQLKQQVDQISQLKGKNDQLEQQVNQLSQGHDQLKESNDQELNKTRGTENELEQHILQLNQERAHLTERQNHLEREVDQLHQNRQQLKERHDELEEQVDRLTQQYTELKQTCDELENLNNQLRRENNSLREQLKSNNEMTQQREAQFKEQLMEDRKLIVEMKQQLDHSKHSLNSSLHQVGEKNSLLMTSQSRCQMLEKRLHEADTRNLTLQKQHDKIQSENSKLQRELSKISVILKEMRVSAQQKERELSMLRLQVKQQSELIFLSKMQNHAASNDIQKQRLFVALLDYYPQSFCKSGHPERELQLQAGDVVNVIGDMNTDGYYHVQFNNKQGLVPAHFLEEMNVKNDKIKRRLRNQHLSVDLLNSNGDMNNDSTANMTPYHSSMVEFHPSQLVAPPTELRVERVLQRGLVVSWTLPNITVLGDSNGLKIQGYQIFIDDILNSTVLGCYQSKALIGSINVDKPHLIAVATFAVNGTLSTKCHTHYKPIHVKHDHHNTMTGSYDHQTLQSPHHQNYQLMKVVHSPMPSDRQLKLQEGDTVKVFGRLRKDGNYIAEIYGDHILIPSYLLAPVVSGV